MIEKTELPNPDRKTICIHFKMDRSEIVVVILYFPIYTDLEMAVASGGPPSGPRFGYSLSLVNGVTLGNQQSRVVCVIGLCSIVMSNNDQVAVVTFPAGEADRSAISGFDFCPVGNSNVQSSMVFLASE